VGAKPTDTDHRNAQTRHGTTTSGEYPASTWPNLSDAGTPAARQVRHRYDQAMLKKLLGLAGVTALLAFVLACSIGGGDDDDDDDDDFAPVTSVISLR
jgi:hypothetical protein